MYDSFWRRRHGKWMLIDVYRVSYTPHNISPLVGRWSDVDGVTSYWSSLAPNSSQKLASAMPDSCANCVHDTILLHMSLLRCHMSLLRCWLCVAMIYESTSIISDLSLLKLIILRSSSSAEKHMLHLQCLQWEDSRGGVSFFIGKIAWMLTIDKWGYNNTLCGSLQMK